MKRLTACIILILAFFSSNAAADGHPSGRIDYAIEYFPPANAMIMHGGWGPSNNWTPLNELWQLDAHGWSQLYLVGTPAMAHHSMTYDSDRQVLMVCGRKNLLSPTDFTYETWEFDGSAWAKKSDIPTGIADGDVEIAYDPSRRVTVLYGAGFNPGTAETWEFNGITNTWTQKNPAQQPTAVPDGALMKYNETDGKMTLLVGIDTTTHTETDETWLWDGTNWTQATGAQPQNFLGGGMAFDSARGEIVLLSTSLETWTFNGTAWQKKTPPTSPPPPRNSFFSVAYDPLWRVALFFGGEVMAPGSVSYPEKTWQWNGAAWSEWSPPTSNGDSNGDGMVGIADAILILKAVSFLPPPSGVTLKLSAEANGDGKIGIADAICVLQKAAGLRTASIRVFPARPSIALHSAMQFTALETFTDHTTQDASRSVSWSSSAPSVAAVSNAAAARGVATATATGATTVTATSGATSGTALLTVTPATLTSISVTMFTMSTVPGAQKQFTATGTYSDGTHQNLTSQVVWSSADTSVATINDSGLATAVSAGTTAITARDAANVISSQVSLTVAPLTLTRISVTPANTTLVKGYSRQFTATGSYSDGSRRDITNEVTWSSSAPTVLLMSNAAGSKGRASAAPNLVSGGPFVIMATDTASGRQGTTNLTVAPAAVVSIAVTPVNPSIAKGLPVQCRATGTFSDGTERDITASVTWTSSDTAVANVSDTGGSKGLASSMAPGVTTISASDPSTSVSSSTTLTVTPAALVSIAVTPATPTIVKGITQQFTAIGTYTDETTRDMTASVTWSASPAGVVTISNDSGSNGLAASAATGITTVTAQDPATNISGATTLTVNPATVVSFALTPVTPGIYQSSTNQFAAIATYTDNSTTDVSPQATWSSSDTAVATINTSGLAFSLSPGATTITATFNGTSKSTTLTVTVNTAKVTAVSAGGRHTMALKEDGTVWTWGGDDSGQLGIGITNGAPYPTPWAVNGLSNAIAIAAGDGHSMALKQDGTVWTWGNNYNGELGNGTRIYSNIPQQVSGLTNVVAIAAGTWHSLALRQDGTVLAWGLNNNGQLGNGTIIDSYTPVPVSGLSGIAAIAAGYNSYNYSVALGNDGTVWAWGLNGNGGFGGLSTDSVSPVPIGGLPVISALSTGGGHTLARTADGAVWAWGSNGCAETGQPVTGWCGNFWVDAPIQTGVTGVSAVASGSGHSVILKGGTVWTWGLNHDGQLGYGYADIETTNSHPTPTQVSALTDITAIAAHDHTVALKSDGTIWAWGNNAHGQIGNGTTKPSWPYGVPSPVQVNPF